MQCRSNSAVIILPELFRSGTFWVTKDEVECEYCRIIYIEQIFEYPRFTQQKQINRDMLHKLKEMTEDLKITMVILGPSQNGSHLP